MEKPQGSAPVPMLNKKSKYRKSNKKVKYRKQQ